MNELVNAWVYNTNKWIERNTEEINILKELIKHIDMDTKVVESIDPIKINTCITTTHTHR